MAINFTRGDTFKYDIGAKMDDGSLYLFLPGDVLRVGIKNKLTNSRYVAFKEIEVTEKKTAVTVEFPPSETKKWSLEPKILEAELTDTHVDVRTIYQDKIEMKGDVIK
jgi:hypothetical protein